MRSVTGLCLLHVPRKDLDGRQHLVVYGAEPASRVEGAAPDKNANGFFSIPKGFDEMGPDESISARY